MPELIATSFTPVGALIGGVLIGLSVVVLLVISGRLAGCSGVLGGLLPPKAKDWDWRVAFVLALIGGAALTKAWIHPMAIQLSGHWALFVAAGLIVGVGVRVGSGCSSGHAVCGIGRLSRRSYLATGLFMGSAAVTVFVIRHVIGGAS